MKEIKVTTTILKKPASAPAKIVIKKKPAPKKAPIIIVKKTGTKKRNEKALEKKGTANKKAQKLTVGMLAKIAEESSKAAKQTPKQAKPAAEPVPQKKKRV